MTIKMTTFTLVLLATALPAVMAQQIGKQSAEQPLPMNIQQCTKAGGCTTEEHSIVMDANWRWLHKVGTTTNCYEGNEWDTTLCPDGKTCAQNCGVDGIAEGDWESKYGVQGQDSTGVELTLVTHGQYATNVGSRVFLLNGQSSYEKFKLKNREFTFDVDVSNLPCGVNGALYFVEMSEDGDATKGNNKAGAQYGTGYCDAQCPHDIKFIDGEANCEGWKPSATDPNAGVGKYGTCCAEMDIWESNTEATAVTPHVCSIEGQYRCEGTECGDDDAGNRFKGVCDKNGCDFNPYRVGNTTFFGSQSTFDIDSTKPMTVVTQFLTEGDSDDGDLIEIKRFFVQNGKTLSLPYGNLPGLTKYNSITQDYCDAKDKLFADNTTFGKLGGLKAMGDAMGRGMVLVMSMWDDHAANMLWLDSDYPSDEPESKPGIARGTCSTDSGDPKQVEKQYPGSSVKYYNVKFGEIGSTTPNTPSPSPGPSPPPSPGPGPSPSPTPSGCPGGSLSDCIDLCPSSPASAYKACVQECVKRCS